MCLSLPAVVVVVVDNDDEDEEDEDHSRQPSRHFGPRDGSFFSLARVGAEAVWKSQSLVWNRIPVVVPLVLSWYHGRRWMCSNGSIGLLSTWQRKVVSLSHTTAHWKANDDDVTNV